MTTAQLRDAAERCRRLARGIGDPLTTELLAALAEIYAADADEQDAKKRRVRRGLTDLGTAAPRVPRRHRDRVCRTSLQGSIIERRQPDAGKTDSSKRPGATMLVYFEK